MNAGISTFDLNGSLFPEFQRVLIIFQLTSAAFSIYRFGIHDRAAWLSFTSHKRIQDFTRLNSRSKKRSLNRRKYRERIPGIKSIVKSGHDNIVRHFDTVCLEFVHGRKSHTVISTNKCIRQAQTRMEEFFDCPDSVVTSEETFEKTFILIKIQPVLSESISEGLVSCLSFRISFRTGNEIECFGTMRFYKVFDEFFHNRIVIYAYVVELFIILALENNGRNSDSLNFVDYRVPYDRIRKCICQEKGTVKLGKIRELINTVFAVIKSTVLYYSAE